jgi:hypothetical protein
MTIGDEQQTNSDQGVGTTDLKSELRRIVAEDFKERLTQSKHISKEQCERLCNSLAEDSISASDIVKALTGDEESTSHE